MVLNIEDFFEVPGAEIFNPDKLKPVRNVSIDSRKVKKGSLFIAIKGKKFNGHSFIRSAIKNGAAVVMMNRNRLNDFYDVELPIITIKNTTRALGDIARVWRKKLNIKVIGITGSTGKTSTKDMLSVLLNEKYKVSMTIRNNNNHIGVPLTILSANENHNILVAELGTNHFGEIEYTADILNPDYALITNIGSSHLEFLKNKNGVLKEKIALFRITKNRNGKIFINNDDPLLKQYSRKYKNNVTYAFSKNSDISGRIVDFTSDGRPVIEVKYKDQKMENTLPLYGEQSAKNYLAATAIALNLGLTKKLIEKGTRKLAETEGRLNVHHFKNFMLIDDTYNASPDSMRAAIDLVARIKMYKRKVLILGDMLELGKGKLKLHQDLSTSIVKNRIDEVFTIGTSMRSLHKKLNEKKILLKNFRTRKTLMQFLNTYNTTNSVILVKGSRGMRMEEFAELILSKAKN